MSALTFGLGISSDPGADPVRQARHAEALGFDFVSASDHPSGTAATFETWTMLTWIAASTERIGIATRVLGVPYRPPAMVAKMAESLDRLSGGRLILGLGGGYSDEEFRAFGLNVPSPRDKVDGMEEAITIARGLWSEPAFTHRGRIFHTDAADMEPKADRRIPIWLGTYGPRALEVTGRLADGWIPSLGFAGPEAIPPMRDRILRAAEQAGRDPGEITFTYNVPVDRTEPPSALAERLTGYVALGFGSFNFTLPPETWEEHAERLITALTGLRSHVGPELR